MEKQTALERVYQFEFHSGGVVLSKDVTHLIFFFFVVNKWSQMDEESVMKHKCKA